LAGEVREDGERPKRAARIWTFMSALHKTGETQETRNKQRMIVSAAGK